jgi:hypothetical protein
MAACFIRVWGNQRKVFSWDYSDRLNREKYYPEITSGFIKKFMFSKRLIVYRRDEDWFVYLLGKEVFLKNIQKMEVDSFGLLSKLTLVFEGEEYSFFEFIPFDLFARKLDPTYDSLDSELVFGRWLVNLYHKANK